jgi:hypothetical protein
MEFGIGVNSKNVVKEARICENRELNACTLLKGVLSGT